MKAIKEIILYTVGDSRKISTWSNIPYFVAETLIAKGIKVNRVDLSPPPFWNRIYMLICFRLLRLFNRRTSFIFVRTRLHFLLARRRIRRALEEFKSADAGIFLTFSFSHAGLSDRPAVQFSDWTYDYFFSYFENRKPDWLERQCVRREDSQIEGANVVFPLFPSVAEYMRSRYRNGNILYLGNVINSLCDPDAVQALEKKAGPGNLLFIGDVKYREGARSLVAAFRVLKAEFPALVLDVVGMEAREFDDLPPGVTCHGYLDKGDAQQRDRFYSLLRNAGLFVNTTPKWGAFSATLEALHFYTPVIVTPYKEFTETFGRAIPFGTYCGDESLETLCGCIRGVLKGADYKALCVSAHEAVREFTWSAYIDRMVRVMEERQEVLRSQSWVPDEELSKLRNVGLREWEIIDSELQNHLVHEMLDLGLT